MKYELIKASSNDIDYIKKSKLYNIFKYAHDLPNSEIEKINNYVERNIPLEIDDYKIIVCNNIKIGCLYVTNKDDGVIIDEIYLDGNYRNKGIGTKIITNIINNNSIIYLWVYKENKKAISLYTKLGFKIHEETETRYYMKKS